MQRSAVSPGMARQLMEMIAQTDLHCGSAHDPRADAGHPPDRRSRTSRSSVGREVASLIPGARFIEYPGQDTYGWVESPAIDDIEEFLTGRRRPRRSTACSRP